MVGLRDFQQYVNFLIEAGSKAEEVVDVPSDYPDHIRAGNDYKDLVKSAGWRRLLDDMESRANKRLAALRACESNDPNIIKGLRDRWVEAEDSLKFVQTTAGEAIERRRAILRDLGTRFGGLDLDGGADDHKIRDFMGLGPDEDLLNDNNHNQSGIEEPIV